ncbi:MAG TPA: sigma 54-interacting transcriptional regulator [Myxococcaceae bacterium]|nr:sigma 54-interacting transcriptional regulator [Myxococcaceae bacterium]
METAANPSSAPAVATLDLVLEALIAMASDTPLPKQMEQLSGESASNAALAGWLLALQGKASRSAEELDQLRQAGPNAQFSAAAAETVGAMAMVEAGLVARAAGALERAEASPDFGARASERAASLAVHAQLLLTDGAAQAAGQAASAALDAAGVSHVAIWGYCLWAAAEVALAAEARDRALALAREVESLGVGGVLRARAALLVVRAGGGGAEAPVAVERVMEQLVTLGGGRDLGLSYMAMADLDATRPGGSPSSWLAKAQHILAESGTAADQHRLAKAFRVFGRREVDRVMDADVVGRVDHLRQRRARLWDVLAAQRDARTVGARGGPARTKADDVVDELLASVQRDEEELIKSVESIVVQRERITQLVSATQELGVLDDVDGLMAAIPVPALALSRSVGAQLFDLPDAWGLKPLQRAGAPIEVPFDELTREAVQALTDGKVHTLAAAEGQRRASTAGPTAVIPLKTAGSMVLVVQRSQNSGFTERELEQLTLYASFASASLARTRSTVELREAALRDAATLAAIRDGVLSLDRSGVVRAINDSAARLLRLNADAIRGRALADLPALAPVGEALQGGRGSAQGEVVSLPDCDVLIRWQRYEGGVVATMQELGTAQKLAHRLIAAPARFRFEDLVGEAAALQECLRDARRAASSDLPVLITGESGTGKEMLAQAIHNASPRAGQPFVGVNVAAIPRELLESELFGYERGAFTGAREGGQAGKFEVAERGTILLDELGDMPLEMQAKLLRVLQERTVQRLGGVKEIPVRARVIATTHRDLERAVAEGSFRLDLFHRIRVVHLRLPPLRERQGDIPRLVEHTLRRYTERVSRLPIKVAPNVMDTLVGYQWPGNVRELANLIEGEACLLAGSESVIEKVPAPLLRSRTPAPSSGAAAAARGPGEWPSAEDPVPPFEEVEKKLVAHALKKLGNVAAAAEALGLSKATLYNKIKQYKLRGNEGAGS